MSLWTSYCQAKHSRDTVSLFLSKSQVVVVKPLGDLIDGRNWEAVSGTTANQQAVCSHLPTEYTKSKEGYLMGWWYGRLLCIGLGAWVH